MAKVMPSSAADAVKKKQLILLGAGGAVLLGVIMIGAWLAGGDKKPKEAAKKLETINTAITPGSQLNDGDVWRATEASKVQALSQEIESLKQTIAKGQSQPGTPTGPAAGMGGFATSQAASSPLPPPPPPPPLKPMQPIDGSQLAGRSRSSSTSRPGAEGEQQIIEKSVFTLEIGGGSARPAVSAKPASTTTDANSGKADNDDKNAGTYLPAGTFMRVVMLSGLDAPTGGQAQNNPHPVLFRVLDNAQLPNRFRARMRDCVITANGFGDISSERAYIRLDRLSCVDENGGVVDEALKGYIAGEDGKTGMRGRLISKQGQALANAFLAGIASGLSNAVVASSTTTSTSALGSTSSIDSGKELQAGLAGGVGSAMDRLAKYYIQLAEKIFPVISVDGGRVVDAVITKGVSIDRE